jgi:hypothetical protein
VRYTLDGTDPTEDSPAATGPIPVDGAAESVRVKARTFWPDGRRSRLADRVYRKAVLRPALELATPAAGIAYRYYEGSGLVRLADVNKCEEVSSGVHERFDLAMPRNRDEQFLLVFEGFLRVPADGVYDFFTSSDDGSSLTIDGELVVDNDGLHGVTERSGQVALQAGFHRIEVRFFEAGGGDHLGVSWAGPDLPKQEIPGSVLFH